MTTLRAIMQNPRAHIGTGYHRTSVGATATAAAVGGAFTGSAGAGTSGTERAGLAVVVSTGRGPVPTMSKIYGSSSVSTDDLALVAGDEEYELQRELARLEADSVAVAMQHESLLTQLRALREAAEYRRALEIQAQEEVYNMLLCLASWCMGYAFQLLVREIISMPL